MDYQLAYTNDQDLSTVPQSFVDLCTGATRTLDVAFTDLQYQGEVDALLTAHRRGVIVRVVMPMLVLRPAVWDPQLWLLHGGIPIGFTRPGADYRERFAVADGQRVWLSDWDPVSGARILGHSYALVLDSPDLAERFTQEFDEVYDRRHHGYDKADLDTPTQIDTAAGALSVIFGPGDQLVDELLDWICTADERLVIAGRALTHLEILDALVLAAVNDVDVCVLVRDDADAQTLLDRARATADDGRVPQALHVRVGCPPEFVLVVDEVGVLLGGAALDETGVLQADQYLVAIDQSEIVVDFLRHLHADWAQAVPYVETN